MVDLQRRSDLAGTDGSDVADGDQTGFGHQVPQILGMALAHFADPEYSYPQLRHSQIPSCPSTLPVW